MTQVMSLNGHGMEQEWHPTPVTVSGVGEN